MKRQGGFTLIEMVIVLAVVAILAAILTPTIAKSIDDSKRARALNEGQVIAAAIASFYKDVGRWPVWNGAAAWPGGANAVDRLHGQGSQPLAGGVATWRGPVTPPDADDDNFENQLVFNDPRGQGNPYPTTDSEFIWRGPYLTEAKADPWGTRYVCNAQWLWNDSAVSAGDKAACYVLSSGSNQIPETTYDLPINSATTIQPAGDDIGVRVQ